MQRAVDETLRQLLLGPRAAFAIGVAQDDDVGILDVGVGHDDLRLAVAVQINHRRAHAHAIRSRAAEGNVRVRHPFAAAAVLILKPRVRPQDIEVAVAIDIQHAVRHHRPVDRGPDGVAFPRLARIGGDFKPAQLLQLGPLVTHHHDIGPVVAIDVRHDDVMRPGGFGGEGDALERQFARFARVAIPHAAANQVHPAVMVDVQGGQSHVRLIIRAHQMFDPFVRSLILEPIELARVRLPAAEDEVQIPVPVQILQCGQPKIARAIRRHRQRAADEMMGELEIRSRD